MTLKTIGILGTAIILSALTLVPADSTDIDVQEEFSYEENYGNLESYGQTDDFTNSHDYNPEKYKITKESWKSEEWSDSSPETSYTKFPNSQNRPNPNNDYKQYQHVEKTPSNYNGDEKLQMQPEMDRQRGIALGYYPLPQGWKIQNDGWHGPNGVKVTFNNTPMQDMNQKRYQSPQQLLRGDIGGIIQKHGGRVLKTEQLRSIADADQRYGEVIKTSNSEQKSYDAIGGYASVKNEKGYFIIKTSTLRNQSANLWNYSFIALDADPSYLDKAVKYLVYALSNYQPNMQQVAMFKSDLRKEAANNNNWAKNNERLKNNQRHFEARNKAIVDAGNATNDAIMGSYKSSSESFNRSSQMIHNGIYNENTTTNPYDGTTHQTDAMYDRTFMNAFGEQIQTNDQFYQPGINDNNVGYEEVYPNGGY